MAQSLKAIINVSQGKKKKKRETKLLNRAIYSIWMQSVLLECKFHLHVFNYGTWPNVMHTDV